MDPSLTPSMAITLLLSLELLIDATVFTVMGAALLAWARMLRVLRRALDSWRESPLAHALFPRTDEDTCLGMEEVGGTFFRFGWRGMALILCVMGLVYAAAYANAFP